MDLDVQGYYQLLPFSLGFFHWQNALLELASLAPEAVYAPYGTSARHFAEAMPAIQPGFDLPAFVAAYHQLRIRR